MASPTRWTWVWMDSGSWWWTGRPGVLRFMGSQIVRHDWATELNWITFIILIEIRESQASKESKPVNTKGNQPWILIGRTDAEAPILWPPDAKSQVIRKDPDARKDWGQEERGQQRIRWLDGTMDMSLEGQRNLACCSSWGCKESDSTELLKNKKKNNNKKTMV